VPSCEPKISALFAAAALVFTLMTVTTAAVIVASALSSQNTHCYPPPRCLKRSSHNANEAGSPSSRRTVRQAVAFTLVALALAAIVWAVLGLVWLSPPEANTLHTEAVCADDAEMAAEMDEAKVCVVALLVVGIALLVTTMCCRLEVFLLATGDAPTIDVLMLSPSLGATDRTERTIGAPSPTTARDIHASVTPATPKMIAIV
jgi:hypothetical protein